MGRVKPEAAASATRQTGSRQAGPRFAPVSVSPVSGSRASRGPKRSELRPHARNVGARRAMKLGSSAAAIIAVAGTLYWSIASGAIADAFSALHRDMLSYTADSGLALREVRVDGRGETAIADILNAVGANRGDPILGIDLVAVRQRLENLPWIVSASVERHFPDQLVVSVKEAVPMALWQRNQKLYLVSKNGDVIETANLAKYAKLLIIVGDEAPKKAQALFDMLDQEPELRPHVTAAVLVGKRRWNIRMDNDIDVKLPEEGAPGAWQRFADLNRRNDLLDKDILAVDLRVPNRVVVRQAHPPEVAPVNAKPRTKSNET
jgi:cell division protein FtsQ